MKNQSVSQSCAKTSFSRVLVGVAVSIVAISSFAQTNAEAPDNAVVAANKVEPPKVVMPKSMKVGEATHKLLDMQAKGVMASNRQYPMPVAVAERVYQRYLASFEHPIAEKSGSALGSLE